MPSQSTLGSGYDASGEIVTDPPGDFRRQGLFGKACSFGGFTVPLVFSFRIRMRPGLIDIILAMAAKTTFPPFSKSA
jgi:hypothetical protein